MTSNVFGLEREVYQHGTIGDFIGSTLEGVQSGFIRCVYAAKYNAQNNTVTLLCEKAAGCCQNGCCPKDQFWMTGVFVLLAFVLLTFVIGCCLLIICYQRSKTRQRRQEKEAYQYASSQVGAYPMQTAPPPPGYNTYSPQAAYTTQY